MNRLFLRFLLMIMLVFSLGLMVVVYLSDLYAQSRWQAFSAQVFDHMLPNDAESSLTADYEDLSQALLQQGGRIDKVGTSALDATIYQQLISEKTLIYQDRILHLLSEDLLLTLPLEESEAQLIQRLMRPLFLIAYQRIKASGAVLKTGLSADADAGETLFGKLSLASIKEPFRTQVEQGLVAFEEQQGSLTLWWQPPDTQQVLQLGPLKAPLTEQDNWLARAGAVLLFIGGLALCLWWLMKPLRRELNHLAQVVASFGQGDLDARISSGRFAAIRQIANVFNQMAEQTQSSIRAQKELTYGVSHELRTPITRLNFMLEMAASAESRNDREQHYAAMRASLGELESMVGELLDYARMEGASPQLNYREVNPVRWLQGLLADHRLDWGEGIALEWGGAIRHDKRSVHFDPFYGERALSNVLRNAGRYARSIIRVSCSFDENWLLIRVEDDGPGIPPESRDRVFEPFTRLDTHRSKRHGGHGLGLAIVRKIMSWHRGDVTIGDS
ncbi:ATP-binding protein, partial [Oceanospirillum sp. HFRX-1_2]